jgi:uncharacterized protein YqgC (DUF456 family)
MKKIAGVILIIIGFLALITPLTPGSWLIFVGLGLLGIQVGFWEDLRNKYFKKEPKDTIDKE